MTLTAHAKYCPGCGEGTALYSVQLEGGIEVRCAACGFPLDFEPTKAVQETGSIMIADDDKFFRTLLADLLGELGFSNPIHACESGQEFLTLATEQLRKELPIRFAVLDIMMAPLDGIGAALSLRAVEKGFRAKPTPVLFLSAVRSDDTLRRLIARCQPALYLNKGTDSRPDKLGPRLEKVIGYLLHQGQGEERR